MHGEQPLVLDDYHGVCTELAVAKRRSACFEPPYGLPFDHSHLEPCGRSCRHAPLSRIDLISVPHFANMLDYAQTGSTPHQTALAIEFDALETPHVEDQRVTQRLHKAGQILIDEPVKLRTIPRP
jgi:hypothetical protein